MSGQQSLDHDLVESHGTIIHCLPEIMHLPVTRESWEEKEVVNAESEVEGAGGAGAGGGGGGEEEETVSGDEEDDEEEEEEEEGELDEENEDEEQGMNCR